MKRRYLQTYIKIAFFIGIIISIILGVGYFLKKEYHSQQFETIKTDMLLIQAKTKMVAEKMKMKEKDATYIGKKIEEVEENEDIRKLQESKIINLEEKNNQYYILEKKHLEELGLATINLEKSYYIVEYNSNEIIYANGIKDKNGNMLYKLSDIENIK